MSTKKIILLDEVDKTELQTDIDGKAPIGHKHSTSDVIGPLPVSKGGLGLSTLHTNQVFYTSEQNVVSQLEAPTEPSVLVQGTKTIHNLLGRSGMFDKSDFFETNSGVIGDGVSIDNTHVKYGSYALKLTGSSSTTEVTYTLVPKNENSIFHLIPYHIYYIRVETYQEAKVGDTDIYWPIAEPSFLSGQSGPAGQWNLISAVNNRSNFSEGYYPLRLDFNNNSENGDMWLDGLMLIDLTADFGAGNEPDKAWCDANLPYFSNKYNIKYDKPYWKPLNDIGIKSVVTLKGRENTTFTVSLKGKVVASGQIGPNGISVIELKETGDYAIHAEKDGGVYDTTLTINYTGTYEVQINVQILFSTVKTESITAITTNGSASSLWAIGDTREVKLNGTVGAYNFSNKTTYMFIIAFDHNSSIETNGEHHIVCSFAKSAATGGKDIAYVDSYYGTSTSDACFHMNSSNTNSGGWKNSYMRQTICSQFKNAMPSDLRAILRPRTIYTDNNGNATNNSSYVTATTDTVYIPSEFEIQGRRKYANSYEQNHQQQLAYYKNGASKIRYKSNDTSQAAWWWVRSPYSYGSSAFCIVNTGGGPGSGGAGIAGGFAPLITI